MLNERDEDKYEGHEDSEYHFSDDDGNYEIEGDTTHRAEESTTPAAPAAKGNFFSRLTRSRRIIMALVFLVLLYVAYKLVSPTPAPNVDIAAAPPQAAQPAAPIQPTLVQQPAAPTPATAPVAVATQTAAPAQPAPAAAPAAPMNPAMQMAQQLAQNVLPSAPQQAAQPAPAPGAPTYPSMIPVQSQTPSQPAASSLDANVSAIASESQRLMGQLQTQYTQQMGGLEAQNKQMQDQVLALNARVANMEAQLTQIVQMLSRHAQQTSSNQDAGAPPSEAAAEQPGPNVRISYNVQAIIPGRAWLKSDNGEALTVAEGDVIKGVGRVTKIDPYDGIVEINTGTRTVSLSYGNGG